jgi:hypothetical protein
VPCAGTGLKTNNLMCTVPALGIQCWNWMSSARTGCQVLELDPSIVTLNWHLSHIGTGG